MPQSNFDKLSTWYFYCLTPKINGMARVVYVQVYNQKSLAAVV